MRYLIAVVALVLLAACATTPTPAPASPSPFQALATQAPSAFQTFPPAPLPATLAPSPSPAIAPTATISPTAATPDAALRPEFRSDLSLVHSPTIYSMDLAVDSGLTQLTGREVVSYTNRTTSSLADVYFRLFANYPDGGDKISVRNVRVDGAQASTSLESQDTALKVPLASPLAPGGQVRLDLDFDVTIPISNTDHYSDFTESNGIITLPSFYPLIPAYDSKGWHLEVGPDYGDLVYAESSLYDVRVTAPITLTVIASGSAVNVTRQGDTATWRYIAAPMRDFDLNISPVLQKSSGQVEDVTVNSYYLPTDQAGGENVLRWASAALSVYEKRFGPYPFRELDVVETPTTAGGIEYPGLVVINKDFYEKDVTPEFQFDVAHEVAHQWWYSVVGDDQVNTPWMDEALAQYSTLIYFQDTYGIAAADQIRQNPFQALWDRAKKNGEDMPIGLPVSAYTQAEYSEIVYSKGPLYFDAVQQQIGDKFYTFLQTYYSKYKYQLVTPDDFRQLLDQVSGQNLDGLYNQWVLGK